MNSVGNNDDSQEEPSGMLEPSSERNNDSSEELSPSYKVIPDPISERVDLSELRGVASTEAKHHRHNQTNNKDQQSETDLENLAEIIPDVKKQAAHAHHHHNRRPINEGDKNENPKVVLLEDGQDAVELVDSYSEGGGGGGGGSGRRKNNKKASGPSPRNNNNGNLGQPAPPIAIKDRMDRTDSMQVQGKSLQARENSYPMYTTTTTPPEDGAGAGGGGAGDTSYEEDEEGYQASDHALEGGGDRSRALNLNHHHDNDQHNNNEDSKIPSEFMNIGGSAQSMSTATQTHEVRMPMYLPTFKPAIGCTNASDFIVRCFVARLRSGITVVKHGRSRWCKSRLRVLHIHPDGRSLSWKPAEGEPTSAKRPPKLDLSTCLEVRHAWSPDPQNPMYTGTPILRQKCEAGNAHKSFALIFKQRTVDITAVTADQCKVLMEGFSALCFRLQVANLAGGQRGNGNNANNANNRNKHARPMPEEDGVSTTASATLTNTSTPRVRG